jgi:hypothetical protein
VALSLPTAFQGPVLHPSSFVVLAKKNVCDI